MLSEEFTAQDLDNSVQLDAGTGIFADSVLVGADSRNRMFCSPSQIPAPPIPQNLTLIVNVLLEQPLTALREILENNLKVSLKDHEFYLQDTLKLDPRGSLVAQCTHETGAVQVHVEIKQMDTSLKPRINILDIMISADELTDIDRTSVIQQDTPPATRQVSQNGKSNFSVKHNTPVVNSKQQLPRLRNLQFGVQCDPVTNQHIASISIPNATHSRDILTSAPTNEHVGVQHEDPGAGADADADVPIGFDEQDEAQLAVTSLQLAYGSPQTKRMAMQSHAAIRDRYGAHATSRFRDFLTVEPDVDEVEHGDVDVDVDYGQSIEFDTQPNAFVGVNNLPITCGALHADGASTSSLGTEPLPAPTRKRTRARDVRSQVQVQSEPKSTREPLFRMQNAAVTSMRMVKGVTYMIVTPDNTTPNASQQTGGLMAAHSDEPELTAAPEPKRPIARRDASASQTVVWQVDADFARLMHARNMPSDPTAWQDEHVREWLAWAARTFQMVDIFSAISGCIDPIDASANVCGEDDFLFLSHVAPTDGKQLLRCSPQSLLRLLNVRMEMLSNVQKQAVRAFLTHFEILKTLKIVSARSVCASSPPRLTTRGARKPAVDSGRNIASCNQSGPNMIQSTCDSLENSQLLTSRARTVVDNVQPTITSLRDAAPTSSTVDVESASNSAVRCEHSSIAVASVSASNVNASRRSRTNGWLTNEVSIIHNVARSFAGGSYMQLWQFLLDLLTDADYFDLIRWTNDDGATDGEFEFIAPQRVAELWGAKKQNGRSSQRHVDVDTRRSASPQPRGMTYAKMARILRYYYQANVLAKVPAKRRTYRFTIDLKEVTGYEPAELKRLVDTCRGKRKAKTSRSATSASAYASRRKANCPVTVVSSVRTAKTTALAQGAADVHRSYSNSSSGSGPVQIVKILPRTVATQSRANAASFPAPVATNNVQRAVKQNLFVRRPTPQQLVESTGRTRVGLMPASTTQLSSLHDHHSLRLSPQPSSQHSHVPLRVALVQQTQATSLVDDSSTSSRAVATSSNAVDVCTDVSTADTTYWQTLQTGDESSRVRTVSSSSTNSLLRQFMNSNALGLTFSDNDTQLQVDGNEMEMMFTL